MISGAMKRGARAAAMVPLALAVLAATILSAGTAIAAGTPQQKCDKARLLAWGGYVGCMENVKAKAALNEAYLAKYWGCRHRYLKKWTAFQSRAALGGSTCSGPRFTDNGATVTDNLTGLVWEKKTGPFLSGIHNWQDYYAWGWPPAYDGTGPAFTYFLFTVNDLDSDGTKGWRLPTLTELSTILLDTPCNDANCTCSSDPCIGWTVFGWTQSGYYWSSTTQAGVLPYAWAVWFPSGFAFGVDKDNYHSFNKYVRAVRGGL